jgi:menaquinone-dependent protoporphyrinogen oxidase
MSCMYEGETVQKQFDDNFPEEIRKHAFARGFFGGEFDFQKMNFVEKMIVRKVVKINESVSRVDQQAIRKFIEQVKAQETEIA